MKFVFLMLDLNKDGRICENDLIRMMKMQDDEIFIRVFSSDISKITKFYASKSAVINRSSVIFKKL